MANELVHASVGTALTQAEWEDVNTHVLNNSTQGDILFVDSTGLIKRLAANTAGSALITNGAGANPSWGPGTFSTWAPGLNQGGAVGCTVDYADYCRLGTIVLARFQITSTAAGTGGNTINITNVPAAIAPRRTGGYHHCGSGVYRDTGTAHYGIEVVATSSSVLQLIGYNDNNYFGAAPAVTIAANDQVSLTLMYETT